MFNKSKIEELNKEIERLGSLVQGLSQFGALGIVEVKEEPVKPKRGRPKKSV